MEVSGRQTDDKQAKIITLDSVELIVLGPCAKPNRSLMVLGPVRF